MRAMGTLFEYESRLKLLNTAHSLYVYTTDPGVSDSLTAPKLFGAVFASPKCLA